jgi:hypothetical protein
MKNEHIARKRLILSMLAALAFSAGAAFAQEDQQAPAQPQPATNPTQASSPQPAAPAPEASTKSETATAPKPSQPTESAPAETAQAPSPQAAAPTEQPVSHPETESGKALSDKIAEDAVAARAAAKAESEANAAMAKKTEVTEKADKPMKGEAKSEQVAKSAKSEHASGSATKSAQVAGKAESAKSDAAAKKTAQADAPAKSANADSAVADAPPPSPEAVAAADLKVRTELAHDKFDLLDSSHDGFIDRQEAAKSNVLKTQFARFDLNKDGKLSLEEFAAINDLAAIKPAETTAKRSAQ